MARILIVDDSSLSRRLLRRILEPNGYEVIEATDGMVALERYFVDRPDLVLLDMTMVGMHGLDVLSQIKEMDRNAVVIVASADIQTATRTLAAAGGARGYLTKPFSVEQVLEAVEAALVGDAR